MKRISPLPYLNRALRRALRKVGTALSVGALMMVLGAPAQAQEIAPADAKMPEIEWQLSQEGGQMPPTQPTRPDQPVRTMKVDNFTFEGNTLLKEDELQKIVAPFKGQDLSLAQMKDLAKEVTLQYQRQGYFLTRALVPVQNFENNTVRIQVVEGKIGTITVEGNDHFSADFIRERFQVGVADGNFRSEDFQRALILLNEIPDLQVKAVLKPGKEVGTADVLLKVKDNLPVHPGIDYNNYGTPETGENRIGLNLDAGNLITDADMLSLRGVIGFPGANNTFVSVNYALPVDDDGTSLSMGFANGAFTVSQGLGAILDVRGDANIYSLAVSRALERDLDFSSNIGFALAYKDIENSFFGGRFPFSQDRYTTARLTYQADWRGATGRTLFQGAYTQGLGGTSGALVSRLGATGGFSKFNLDLARVQTLTDGVYGILRGSAQLATQPLYVAEQYAIGGPDTVRGFSQAELLGDNAYNLSAELRWSPIEDEPNRFQMAFFVDHGGVSLKRRLPGDLPNGDTLTGAGLGFRVGFSDYSNLRLDVGWPISPTRNRQGNSPAVYAGLQTRF